MTVETRALSSSTPRPGARAATRAVVAASVAFCVACSTQQPPPTGPSGTSTDFQNVIWDDVGNTGADGGINSRMLQCVPTPLSPEATGPISCEVLAALPMTGSESDCAPAGLEPASDSDVAAFRLTLSNWSGYPDAGPLAQRPVCVLPQLPVGDEGECAMDSEGWCLLTGGQSGAGLCATAVSFAGTIAAGSLFLVDCKQS